MHWKWNVKQEKRKIGLTPAGLGERKGIGSRRVAAWGSDRVAVRCVLHTWLTLEDMHVCGMP